ncbi:hypothetical protein M0R72_11355 [Candidatus Pacearchaeota archaeon]|jgi:hypothetical protein|nr:hypothetical protein [Candidatus Pacearchaeota archaeon]
MSETFKIVVFKDGKHHHEEYQAIIGIKIDGNNVTLHIRENGDLDEQFWRNLPTAMQQSIEKGLAIRRKVNP